MNGQDGARPGTAALSVHNLGKRFGDRVAFEGVSFEVGYGEVFGFAGPNGAGKTTAVRTLGTLLAPSSRSVLGAVLLVLDILGWRIVSPAFDRERLITGTR